MPKPKKKCSSKVKKYIKKSSNKKGKMKKY